MLWMYSLVSSAPCHFFVFGLFGILAKVSSYCSEELQSNSKIVGFLQSSWRLYQRVKRYSASFGFQFKPHPTDKERLKCSHTDLIQQKLSKLIKYVISHISSEINWPHMLYVIFYQQKSKSHLHIVFTTLAYPTLSYPPLHTLNLSLTQLKKKFLN